MRRPLRIAASQAAGPTFPDLFFRVGTAGVPLLLLGIGLALPLSVGLLDTARLGAYSHWLPLGVLVAVLTRTLAFAALASAVATVLGWSFAVATHNWPIWCRRLVLIACVLPVVTHFILRTYGLQQIFGARGPVNALLMTAGAVQEPLPLTKSSFGTVIALTSWLLPVSVFFMYMVVRSVSRELLDAAVLLGATPVGVLRSVWIPQTSSGATLLLTINFCLAYGTYLSPRLLGGLEDLTVVVLIGQMLNEGRSAEAAMVGTVATVVPVLLMFVVLLVRRVYWRHGT